MKTRREPETEREREREGYSIIGIIPLLLSQSLTQDHFNHFFLFFFFLFAIRFSPPQPRLPTKYFFYGETVSSSFNFSVLGSDFWTSEGENIWEVWIAFFFCLPFDLTHQCRSDLSLDFWFRRVRVSLFLYSWRILLFSLTSGTSLFFSFLPSPLDIRHFRYYPSILRSFKSSSSLNNGV